MTMQAQSKMIQNKGSRHTAHQIQAVEVGHSIHGASHCSCQSQKSLQQLQLLVAGVDTIALDATRSRPMGQIHRWV